MSAGAASVPNTAQVSKAFAELARTRNYTSGSPQSAVPLNDGRTVLYLRSNPDDATLRLYAFDIATGKSREVIAPEALSGGKAETLSTAEYARRQRMRISGQGFVSFQVDADNSHVLLTYSGKLYVVDIKTGKPVELPGTDWVAPQFSPNGKMVAALKGGNIHVIDIADHSEHALTTTGSETLRNGEAEFVAQEEMDRRTGFWWSPDSKSIAYEESDLSPVGMHYIADPFDPGVAPKAFRYPRAGEKNAILRLGVVSLETGKTVWVPWDNKAYPYLSRVFWNKYGPLSFSVMNRHITKEEIYAAEPDGRTKHLWTETNDKWIDLPRTNMPQYLPDGSFLWATERNNIWQLERHNADGSLKNAVTPADFRVDRLYSVDGASNTAVVSGGYDTMSRELYRVSLSGGKPVALTHKRGLNDASFGAQSKVFVRSYSLVDGSHGTDVCDHDGRKIASLPSAAEKMPFAPKVEYLRVGKLKMDAMVIRPRNFDPKKKYPVILTEYTGPAAKIIWAAPRAQIQNQIYADQGYIVVGIDNRGTPGRTADWIRACKYDFIDTQLQDEVDGLEALKKLVPQMEMKHIGVMGWSQGGFFAAMAVMRRPDIFAAGVAGAPPTDFKEYDTYYTERYLGLPQEHPEVYKKNNVMTYAADLKRPLLIVSGVTDDNVYFVNTMKLTTALLKAGKKYEQIVLPGTHMLADPALKSAESMRVLEFFNRTLKK